MAHDRHAEEVDAVLVVQSVELALVLGQVGEVRVQIHVLVDSLEAMQLVVDVERAQVAFAIGNGDANVLSAVVPHVLGLDDDVFGVEKIMPRFVHRWGGLARERPLLLYPILQLQDSVLVLEN